MSLYQSVTITGTADSLTKIGSFLSVNGWVMTAQTADSVIATKAGVTITFWRDSNTVFIRCSYMGLNSAAYDFSYLNYTQDIRMFSCGNNFYFLRTYSSVVAMFGVYTITDKIGAWSGGLVINVPYSSDNSFCTNSMHYYSSQLFKDGVWHPYRDNYARPGSLWGSRNNDHFNNAPFYFNGAVTPGRSLLCIHNATTAYIHPIGYQPDVLRVIQHGSGPLYINGDILTIAGRNYVVDADVSSIIDLY